MVLQILYEFITAGSGEARVQVYTLRSSSVTNSSYGISLSMSVDLGSFICKKGVFLSWSL